MTGLAGFGFNGITNAFVTPSFFPVVGSGTPCYTHVLMEGS